MDDNSLMHHGIKGQKWGVRRFQNPDGSLTDAGKSKKHKESKSGNSKSNNKSNMAKIAKIAGSAVAIGGAAYLANKAMNKTNSDHTKTSLGRAANDLQLTKGEQARKFVGRAKDSFVGTKNSVTDTVAKKVDDVSTKRKEVLDNRKYGHTKTSLGRAAKDLKLTKGEKARKLAGRARDSIAGIKNKKSKWK